MKTVSYDNFDFKIDPLWIGGERGMSNPDRHMRVIFFDEVHTCSRLLPEDQSEAVIRVGVADSCPLVRVL